MLEEAQRQFQHEVGNIWLLGCNASSPYDVAAGIAFLFICLSIYLFIYLFYFMYFLWYFNFFGVSLFSFKFLNNFVALELQVIFFSLNNLEYCLPDFVFDHVYVQQKT